MSFEIKDGRYMVAMWFVGDGKTGDWHGWLYRDTPEAGDWHFEYRFRYYKDPTGAAFTNADEKSFYAWRLPANMTEEAVLSKLRLIYDLNRIRYGATGATGSRLGKPMASEILMRTTSAEEAFRLVTAQPWAHVGSQNPITGKYEPAARS